MKKIPHELAKWFCSQRTHGLLSDHISGLNCENVGMVIITTRILLGHFFLLCEKEIGEYRFTDPRW
jgi:hypothetical protein